MDSAKVIETTETVALPAPVVPDGPNKGMDAADTRDRAEGAQAEERQGAIPCGNT
jgi:hypothetical protein